ncbi:hypothetical protein [Streptomyces collinus]|uniref:hypothetical protein n=1 Tax=Streptomyces collinus TaxID=42684 RepID=UPI00332363BC
MTIAHPGHPAAVPILALEGVLPLIDVSCVAIVDSFPGRGIAEIAAGPRGPEGGT